MHWNAKPSESEKDSIVAWVERGLASLATIGLLPADPDNPKANSESDVIYACPMHPDVTSNSQDNCKICGMMLEVADPDSLSTTDTDH